MISNPHVLGINRRNIDIRHFNTIEAIRLVRDKHATKECIAKLGVHTPTTLALLTTLPAADFFDTLPAEFVIKPNHGSKGMGILVLHRLDPDTFRSPGGSLYSRSSLFKHLARIFYGDFSSGAHVSDAALFETLVRPSASTRFNDAVGLPDVRIFIAPDIPTVAMMRYPTTLSDGKANLAKGAIGIAIDPSDGSFYQAYSPLHEHMIPLSELGIPATYRLPHWPTALMYSEKCKEATGLVITGVDLVLDEHDQWNVLEVNSHPGLEIQNVTSRSLHPSAYVKS